MPIVVKAAGLAGGKGVTIAFSYEKAEEAIDEIFAGSHGGPPVIVEEFLEGRECSVIAITDGTTVLPLAPARDYKPVS